MPATQGQFAALARQGRRLTHPLAALAVAAVIWLISMIVKGSLSRDPTAGASAVESALALVPAMVVGYGLRTLCLWAWVSRFERRPLRTLGLPRAGALGQVVAGAVGGLGMLALVVAVLAATGHVSLQSGPSSLRGTAALGGVALMAAGWLVQASAEEIMFRGFLLQAFAGRGLVVLGVAVQAVLFAVAHGAALDAPLAVVNLLLFSVFAALLVLRQGTLWGAIGIHVAWNWALGNGLGLTVSEQSIPGGSLLSLSVQGPEWLTGGDFGVEGSLVTTVVWTVAVLVLVAGRGRTTPAGIPRPGDASPERSERLAGGM